MEKKPQDSSTNHRALEDILGCKWSVTVLQAVANGVQRPGILERSIPGISKKVLNERLTKLTRYNILRREAFPELPPRVEYSLTELGRRVCAILDQIRAINEDLKSESPAPEEVWDRDTENELGAD